MKNKVIFQMTLAAINIAIIAVVSFIPYVGYIMYGGAAITTVHILVLVIALIFGWKQGLVAGIAFGMVSFLVAITTASSPLDLAFVNPLISIIPRAAFGFLAGITFQTIKRVKDIGYRSSLYAVASIVLTLFHSASVVLMLFVFKGVMGFSNEFNAWLTITVAVNSLIEAAAAGVVVPLIAWPLSRAFPQYSAYKPYKNDTENTI